MLLCMCQILIYFSHMTICIIQATGEYTMQHQNLSHNFATHETIKKYNNYNILLQHKIIVNDKNPRIATFLVVLWDGIKLKILERRPRCLRYLRRDKFIS